MRRNAPLLLVLLLLAGCGSSGGPTTGRLVDGPVAGLRYETPTFSGVTDVDGTFSYVPGETVRFYLGGTMLGQAPGGVRLTLFDLAGATPVTGNRRIQAALRTPAYLHVVNLAVLLQTLDDDGDPSSGLVIRPEVASLYDGVTMDLTRSWYEFSISEPFRGGLVEANRLGLFGAHRAVRPVWLVMQHLYAGMGLGQATVAMILQRRDTNADGTVDETRASHFDAEGRRVGTEHDADADGVADSTTKSGYDELGCEVLFERDDDADGRPEFGATVECDLDGNPTRRTEDTGVDGVPDRVLTDTYDAYGRLLRSGDDTNADGTDDRITTYELDADGRVLRELFDDDGNGLPNRINAYAYDAAGHLVLTQRDTNGDAAFDERTTYEYDGAGRQQRILYDTNADGTADSITTYEYDAAGNRNRILADLDADGTPDEETRYSYDAAGHEIRSAWDQDLDGTPERIIRQEYDAAGNRTRWTHEYLGAIVRDDAYQYDARGNLVRSESDTDGDGTIDEITTYAYGGDGWWSILTD